MSRRLRPVPPRGKKPDKTAPRGTSAAARPTPADLHNPYGRYYTAPRSFEQLVARQHKK